VAQFFSWSAVMSYNLFFTDFVGEGVFHGDPSAGAGKVLNDRYDHGVRVGSWGLLIHCVTCCLFSLVQDRIQQRVGSKAILFFSMLGHTLSVLLMTLTSSSSVILVLSMFPGIVLSALMSIPFTLVNKYHDRHEVFLSDCGENRGIGTDLAIVDSMYFLAEFSLSVIDSIFVVLIGSTYAYMYATVIFGCIATVLVLQTSFTEADVLMSGDHIVLKTVPAGKLLNGQTALHIAPSELPL
jgi:MFS family permease